MADEVKEQSPWDTETGLADDFDGIIANAKFGVKEEYGQKVIESSGGGASGLMFIVDLVDDNGEIQASQGWSVGSGWEPSADGSSMSHPKRGNVVTGSLYGQLQNKVIRELSVDMAPRGLPTDAASWNGLKFHWMQTPHATVGGGTATGLMPTEFLGEVGAEVVESAPAEAVEAAVPAQTPTPVVKPILKPVSAAAKLQAQVRKLAPVKAQSAAEKAALELIANCTDVKDFQKKAVKIAAIANDDAFMSKVLDDGPASFFAQNKK
jgi:hypothetical protein